MPASVPFKKPSGKPTLWFLLAPAGQTETPLLRLDQHWKVGGGWDGHLVRLFSEAALQIYPPARIQPPTPKVSTCSLTHPPLGGSFPTLFDFPTPCKCLLGSVHK